MLGLVLETGTEKGFIALVKHGVVLAARSLAGGPTLSHLLATEVEALLNKDQITPQFIAAGSGPGSHTGLRVGAALGKALAFGWKIPLLGFCNLLSFLPQDDPHCAVLFDARMGGVYYLPHRNAQPTLLSLAESEAMLAPITKIATPHPAMIIKRLPFLTGKCIETDPHPLHLIHSLIDPFSLQYCN